MKNLKLTWVFLLLVLISACIIVLPAEAQDETKILTVSPEKLDFTICYPDGEASQQVFLKNDNDFPFTMQAFYKDIPYYTGVVVYPYDGAIAPHSVLPVDIRVSAKPNGGGPSLPFGEYDGVVIFDVALAMIVDVPVHYSIVHCDPSPEFPVPSPVSVPFISLGMIGALICLVLLVKIK
jgi:hypothetical protein